MSPVPTTQPPPPPIPQDREYRSIGDVIDTAERGPWIAFSVNESLPPQVAYGIPLSSWDWDRVEGEERAGSTTWTTETLALVGTWDGDAFVLTEPPTPATREEEEFETPTTGCDTSQWANITNGLFIANVGVFEAALGGWDGRCGVYIDAVVDSPETARSARATRRRRVRHLRAATRWMSHSGRCQFSSPGPGCRIADRPHGAARAVKR